jgi:hypothetical protein
VTLATRRPTGKPSWPLLLISGREGAGKTWSALEASASPVIGRTIYVGIGEDDPDDYLNIPGADFEIVEHDGTYKGITTALADIATLPTRDDGTATLLVVDSMTRLWDLITHNAQAAASKRKGGAEDAPISMDLWNKAAQQWQHAMDLIRAHNGPVVLTARLDQVTVMKDGKPTTDKVWKIQAHKSLPFDVGAIVEAPERGAYRLTKLKSAKAKLDRPVDWAGFTVEKLWKRMGLLDDAAGPRMHTAPVVTAPVVTPGDDQLLGLTADELAEMGRPA